MADLHYAAVLRKGQKHFHDREYMQALQIGESLLAANRKDLNALMLVAYCHKARTNYEEAIRLFQRCIDQQPKVIETHMDLASLLMLLGRFPQAIARFEKARKLNPNDPRPVIGIADTHEKAGDEHKAIELLQPYIDRGEDDVNMAFIYAKALLAAKRPQEAVQALMRHRNSPTFPASFFHILGKALEQTGDYDTAFKSYTSANELTGVKFDLRAYAKLFDDLMEVFTPELIQRLPRPQHDTSMPIFIVGRPRSGTTLIETILDAHPDCMGIGEDGGAYETTATMNFEIGSLLPYPACVRDLDQDDVNRLSRKYLDHAKSLIKNKKRAVDKSLINFQALGLIQILWPQAKVIHCKRDAVDNCWACYVSNLAIHHHYTADLMNLGITYRYYQRLMRHWQEVLPMQILDVNYEDMVADQEHWTRRILEFCGLPWNDQTLRFYEARKDGGQKQAAITLSYDQVRQPIYKTSVGRAGKFDKFLGPLREGLEIGEREIREKDAARATAAAPSGHGKP